MTVRVAINGFGRIGRSILRALATTRGGEGIEVACINDVASVLGWTDRPLVSTDLRARPESLVLAGRETMLGLDLTRLFGCYDNEWSFSNRMIDIALRTGRRETREMTNVA